MLALIIVAALTLVAGELLLSATRSPAETRVEGLSATRSPAETGVKGLLWKSTLGDAGGWDESTNQSATGPHNARVTTGPCSTNGALQILFGEQGSRWGLDQRHSFQRLGVAPRDNVYFSYDVYFSEEFEFKGDGKMGGLGGIVPGGNPFAISSGGRYDARSFSARATWKRDRGLEAYLYVREADGRVIYGDGAGGYGLGERFVGPSGQTEDLLIPGTWHRIEHRVVLNTPGRADGGYELWLNGHRGVRLSDVEYRSREYPELQVSHLLSSWFFGGDASQYPTRISSAFTRNWALTSSHYDQARLEQAFPDTAAETTC